MLIREATAEDRAEIHAVVAAAFGPSPEGHAPKDDGGEADLVDALRADGDALVELVAVEDDFIVGHALFSPLTTDTGQRFAALAPLSVIPARQNDGLGLALMQVGHELCRKAGVEAVIVLGHPDYYPRAGYSAAAASGVTAPFSGPSFMALALTTDALQAPVTVTYAKAFGL
jgi:putative acetyltransferase